MLLTDNSEIGQVLNKCYCCGEETDTDQTSVNEEDGYLCESCDEYYEWCNICQTSYCVDFSDACRHIFWTEDGWLGCGSYDGRWVFAKPSFNSFLDVIGVDAAKALKFALESHRYYHQFSGSIFGYKSMTAFWGNAEGGHDWRESVFEPFFCSPYSVPPEIEAAEIGVTAGWIQEWLEKK